MSKISPSRASLSPGLVRTPILAAESWPQLGGAQALNALGSHPICAVAKTYLAVPEPRPTTPPLSKSFDNRPDVRNRY
jgi:hypothetical protein